MDAAVDQLNAFAVQLETKSIELFGNGRARGVDRATNQRLMQAVSRLMAPVQEIKHTLKAAHDNTSFHEMVDRFLAVERNLSGVKDDAEAAAIERFRNAIVVVFSDSDRIEVRHGVVDLFRVVIVRAGAALFRYKQVYNEFNSDIMSETVSINDNPERKLVALETTFWLDRDDHWRDVSGDDAAIRAAIGDAADGVSDDSMVQMLYGALSGQIDDLDAIASSVLGDASEFISGEFTEAGEEDDEDDDDEGDSSHKRRKTDDGDDDGAEGKEEAEEEEEEEEGDNEDE